MRDDLEPQTIDETAPPATRTPKEWEEPTQPGSDPNDFWRAAGDALRAGTRG